MHIRRRVDIGRHVGYHVVDNVRQQLFVNPVKQVVNQGRILLQGVSESVAGGYQLFAVTSVEEHKHLILDLQVGKSQFGGTVFIARRRHQFVDIFFQMNL